MKNQEDDFYKILIWENESIDIVKNSIEHIELNESRKKKLEFIKGVGESNDIEKILSMENNALAYDLEHYANNQSSKTSLIEGMEDIQRIQESLDKVADPTIYKEINEQYSKKGEREKGLPKDIAYRSFKSHLARLQNPDRMIGISQEEKEIFRARRQSIKAAFVIYKNKQAEVLKRLNNKTHAAKT